MLRQALPVLLLLTFCSAAYTQDFSALTADQKRDLWLSVREAMRSRVQNLGAYTCIQNISRYETPQNREDERLVDTVRMQVTATSGREFYSWPGSPNAVENPSDLLRTGLLGTGMFQGYAHSLFFSPGPGTIEFLGEETADNATLLHFRFTFDSLRERLIVDAGAGKTSVAAKGEFWAEKNDRSLRRLLVESAEQAPEINVHLVRYILDWAPVRLRGQERLLPQTANIFIELFSGEKRRNEITLSQCNEFHAESTLSFNAEPSLIGPAPPLVISVAGGFLPEGVSVPLRLLTAVDTNQAAVGDPVEAEVLGDVRHKNEIVLRKGDRAEGRIRRVGRYQEPELHTLLWLEITAIHSGGKEFIFLGELPRKNRLANLIHEAQGFKAGAVRSYGTLGGYRIDQREFRSYATVPGVASFLFRGDRGLLPAGYTMDWRTLPPRTDNER